MALTLASNAITFTDSTALSSGIISTAQLSAGAVTTSRIATNAVTFDKISQNSGPFSFRNKIINGNFDIWQRGTNFTRSGGFSQPYTSDRWFAIGIASSLTVNQQPFSPGQTSVPNEPQYFCQCIVTTSPGSTSYAALGHRIENVRTLSGKTAVLTFWAKADSNKSISIEFSQHFGSGGSPSAQILALGVQKLNLTTSWQKFTVLVSVPSIAEKTLGTNGNDHFIVGFWFDAGSNYNSRTNNLGQQSGTFDIAQVQIEEGPVATPFEERPTGLELSLCKRYYNRITGGGTGSNQTMVANGCYNDDIVGGNEAFRGWCLFNLDTHMREQPTITFSDINGFTMQPWDINVNSLTFSTFTRNSTIVSVYVQTVTNRFQGEIMLLVLLGGNWIAFDAEF